jgi:C-terminal processing protease CtpA/Prc
VDLMKLEVAQVPGMFEALGGTDGMIFDLRGYPRGTAWAIAPRINQTGAGIGARFRRREVSRQSFYLQDSGYFFAQPLPELPESAGPPYKGEIVVLIDERAISQSEHSALFFEAAADVTFVGSPTAGANGDVTNLALPGGLSVYFTGHDVRWPDGRQLQRVGVLPDVEAAPTLAGLRAGEDEVLDVGLEVLRRLVAERSGR